MSSTAAAITSSTNAPPAKSARADAPKRPTPPTKRDGRMAGQYAPSALRLTTLALYGLVGLVLYLGWRNREDSYLIAESGDGYLLGIVGGTLMLLLLLYPLRKKARFMRGMGAIKHWFRAHMVFGVLGPVCVLFHANFQLGSVNSNFALACMLLVAGSGLVGRYFYTKIHYGLYGRRVTLEKLHSDAAVLKEKLAESVISTPQVMEPLNSQEAKALATSQGVLESAFRLLTLGIRIRWSQLVIRRRIERFLKAEAHRRGWSAAQLRIRRNAADRFVTAHLAAVRRVAEFSFYERLFSLWHLLHLPLFLMMVAAGVIHVIAVHMY